MPESYLRCRSANRVKPSVDPGLLGCACRATFARSSSPTSSRPFWPARAGERFAEWVRRFVVFHGIHPRDLFNEDVGRFLEHVAHTEKDPLRALEAGQEALTFLYARIRHPASPHSRSSSTISSHVRSLVAASSLVAPSVRWSACACSMRAAAVRAILRSSSLLIR
jgi:hypothetical protein